MPDLRQFGALVVRLGAHRLVPYGGDWALITADGRDALFLNEREKKMVAALAGGQTASAVIEADRVQGQGDSCTVLVDILTRLQHCGLLTAESMAALARQPLFTVPPPPSAPLRLRLPWTLAGWGRLGRLPDSTAGLMVLGVAAGFNLLLALVAMPQLPLLTVGGSYFSALVFWLVAAIVLISLRNFMRHLLLAGHGERIRGGLVVRGGLPGYAVPDAGILAHGPAAAFRLHLAVWLTPGAVALPAALFAVAGWHCSATLPVAAALLMFLDLSPFFPSNLRTAVARLSGRARALERVMHFLDRRLLARLCSAHSFAGETVLLAGALIGLCWLYAAYRIASGIMERYLDQLADVVILGARPEEQLAALLLACAVVLPLLIFAWGLCRLLVLNLWSAIERPWRLAWRRLRRRRRPAATADALARQPAFAALARDEYAALARLAVAEEYPRGCWVRARGEEVDAFRLITSGKALAAAREPDGSLQPVACLQAGDTFGEAALLAEPAIQPFTIIALTPLACLALPRAQFAAHAAARPALRASVAGAAELPALLETLPLFAGIPRALLPQAAAALRSRSFHEGEVIVREGEAGDCFYIVRHGRLQVRRGGGEAAQEVAVLQDGDYFGEIALLADGRRTATVAALSAGELLELPAASFRALVQANLGAQTALEHTARYRRQSGGR